MMKAFFLLFTALLSSTVATAATTTTTTDLVQALQHRRTQESDPCAANEGGLLSVRSFYTGTLGACECSFINDLDDLQNFDQASLGDFENNANYLQDVVDLINDLMRNLSYDYSNSCAQTGCETCYGPVCGTITASEAIMVEGDSETNLTVPELFTLPGLQDALSGGDPDEAAEAAASDTGALTSLFGPNIKSENSISYCMEFTTEFTGQACLKVENVLDGVIETEFLTEDTQACTLSYNGQDCTGCEFAVTDGTSCVTADCTAVTSVNSMVDTCGGSGMAGPMQFLDVTAVPTSTCGETQVTVTCEGLGCDTTAGNVVVTDTGDASGAASAMSFMAVGAAAVVAMVM